jgi:hypothetical protein
MDKMIVFLTPFMGNPNIPPDQLKKLHKIYKIICDDINSTMLNAHGEPECRSMNKTALELFKIIYSIDRTISDHISFGLWGSFKRACVASDDSVRSESMNEYFQSKVRRMTPSKLRNMFSSNSGRGGKKSIKRKSMKRSKRTKRSKRMRRSRK